MTQEAAQEKLKKLKDGGMKGVEIEALFSLPKNSISKIINGTLKIPLKYLDAIDKHDLNCPETKCITSEDWEKGMMDLMEEKFPPEEREKFFQNLMEGLDVVSKISEKGIVIVEPLTEEWFKAREGRNNQFENAARGIDKGGINEYEIGSGNDKALTEQASSISQQAIQSLVENPIQQEIDKLQKDLVLVIGKSSFANDMRKSIEKKIAKLEKELYKTN